MGKKVTVISTSLRHGSNSAVLADAFAMGASEAGNEVTLISLTGKPCYVREISGLNDMQEIVRTSDVLVFATPIYYYEMSGQMKTFLDRLNPLYIADCQFKDVYLLASAAEEDEYAMKRAKSGLEGWIECFPQSHFAGSVFAGGMTNPGMAKESAAFEEARKAGMNV